MIITCAQAPSFTPIEVKIVIQTQEEYELFARMTGSTSSIPKLLVQNKKITKESEEKLNIMMSHIYSSLTDKKKYTASRSVTLA